MYCSGEMAHWEKHFFCGGALGSEFRFPKAIKKPGIAINTCHHLARDVLGLLSIKASGILLFQAEGETFSQRTMWRTD